MFVCVCEAGMRERRREGGEVLARSWLFWTVLCRRVLGCLHSYLSLSPSPPLFVYLFACLFFLCSLLDEVPGLFIWRPKPWCAESQTNPSLPFCYPHLLLLTGYLLLLLFWQAALYSSHSSSSSSSSSTAHFSASLFHSYSFPLSSGNSATFFFFFIFVTRNEGQEGESEQMIETKQKVKKK